MSSTDVNASLVGHYRPNFPGARSLAESRPLSIGPDIVTVHVNIHPTRGDVWLSVFIGLRMIFDGPLPAEIVSRADVNPYVARMALASA